MFVSHLYVLFLIFDFVFLSKFCLYIYLFLAELGLCCCPGFSLVAVSGGPSVAVMCKFLSVVAPGHTGFSSCSSQAYNNLVSFKMYSLNILRMLVQLFLVETLVYLCPVV